MATIKVVSIGVSPLRRRLPAFLRLEFGHESRKIGHIELFERGGRGLGVAIGGAADQREAGERAERVDFQPAFGRSI